MKFAKPRIVAKKMQLFEASRVLLAKGRLGLVSLGKHASGEVFALIILLAKNNATSKKHSVQKLDARVALDGIKASRVWTLVLLWTVRGCPELDARGALDM